MLHKHIAKLALSAVLTFASSPALAQAFGIEPGVPVRTLQVTEDLGGGVYSVEVPLPNTAFETYLVVATPGHGVCKVRAIGRTFRADSDGSQVRSAYDDLQLALTERYGTPSNDFDFLQSGALWDGRSEFAASIRQNERTLATYWRRPASNQLADTISGIGLEVEAINLNDTYLTLTYELSNWSACSAARANANNRGL